MLSGHFSNYDGSDFSEYYLKIFFNLLIHYANFYLDGEDQLISYERVSDVVPLLLIDNYRQLSNSYALISDWQHPVFLNSYSIYLLVFEYILSFYDPGPSIIAIFD